MLAWTKVRDETDGFDLVEHPILCLAKVRC